MDFRLTDDQQHAAPQCARVRRGGDSPARDGVGRGAAVSDGPAAEARGARADGHPVPGGVRRRRRCRRSTTASASRSSRGSCPAVALSVAAHNGLCSAHIAMFGTDEQKQRVPAAAGARRGARRWGLTEAGAGSDAAGMRTTAVARGDGWVLNGAKTFITHGRIGGVMVVMAVTDRAKGHRGISAFIVEHGTPGMTRGQEGKQARHARERHERGDLRRLPRAGVDSCSARKGRDSSTRCRCSTPGASGSPRCRSDWRRAPTKRRATTPASGGSSASRSRRFRRSSGSWRTWRRGSRRRGC